MLSEYETKSIYTYQEVKVLHLELTNKCNALCPMCARSIHGSIENPNLDLAELRLNDLEKILPLDFVERLDRVV
jgi:MoaA/NifB/PqqE/SkfB family radical SAM enzyme